MESNVIYINTNPPHRPSAGIQNQNPVGLFVISPSSDVSQRYAQQCEGILLDAASSYLIITNLPPCYWVIDYNTLVSNVSSSQPSGSLASEEETGLVPQQENSAPVEEKLSSKKGRRTKRQEKKNGVNSVASLSRSAISKPKTGSKF